MGNPGVHVLATPALVHLCERAAVNALQEGDATVALRSTVAHVAAAPLAAEVTATAKLEEEDGARLTFSVEARMGDLVLMAGTHERRLVARQDRP